MPSSRPNTIPTVVHLIRQLKPRSLLDVGIGFGKWGHLFREYTDILEAEHDPSRYERKNWKIQIDGVEGFPQYISEMHRYLYNEIHIGDACELIRKLPRYDIIFMGDIIEHLEKKRGLQLLRDSVTHANKAVIVSTPKYETAQGDLCANEMERRSAGGNDEVELVLRVPAAKVSAQRRSVLSLADAPLVDVLAVVIELAAERVAQDLSVDVFRSG